MPVEIKELVIRAVVESMGAETRAHICRAEGPKERELIVAAAVSEVLRILRKAKER